MLTERQAMRRDRWRLHGASGGPGVDLLAPLAASGGDYRVDIGPQPNCAGQTPPPSPGFEDLRQIRITPTAAGDSCLTWWALDVYTNDAAQIETVSLHRGER